MNVGADMERKMKMDNTIVPNPSTPMLDPTRPKRIYIKTWYKRDPVNGERFYWVCPDCGEDNIHPGRDPKVYGSRITCDHCRQFYTMVDGIHDGETCIHDPDNPNYPLDLAEAKIKERATATTKSAKMPWYVWILGKLRKIILGEHDG